MAIFRTVSFYLAIAGILLAFIFGAVTQKVVPPAFSINPPTESPFPDSIATTGIVEALDKNIEIGVPEEGLVEKLWFQVGDTVKEGDPLLRIDSRSLEAKLLVQKANVEVESASLERLKDQLNRLQSVKDPRAISVEELKTRENDVKVAEAKLKAAEASFLETQELINRLTVRAPKNGIILQEDIRVGEYITRGKAAMILGDLDQLQVRVDIDEQNAGKFRKDAAAVAFPKNNTSIMIPLKFVRIEPYVIPKKSLRGTSEERVDTRVLQVIYSFEQPEHYHFYVGQQADVYIEK